MAAAGRRAWRQQDLLTHQLSRCVVRRSHLSAELTESSQQSSQSSQQSSQQSSLSSHSRAAEVSSSSRQQPGHSAAELRAHTSHQQTAEQAEAEQSREHRRSPLLLCSATQLLCCCSLLHPLLDAVVNTEKTPYSATPHGIAQGTSHNFRRTKTSKRTGGQREDRIRSFCISVR